MKTITVLLADDHQLVRQGLLALLRPSKDINVIGAAHNGSEAVSMTRELRPDVIVMDLSMQLVNGVEATQQILAGNPAAKIIILSGHNDDEHVMRLIELGASGYLFKQTSAQLLVQAIHEVFAGNKFFSSAIVKSFERRYIKSDKTGEWQRTDSLTARELEVVKLITSSHSNKEIADTLSISVKTVEKHRQQVMDKLNIHEAAGLTRYAINQGLIPIPQKLLRQHSG